MEYAQLLHVTFYNSNVSQTYFSMTTQSQKRNSIYLFRDLHYSMPVLGCVKEKRNAFLGLMD